MSKARMRKCLTLPHFDRRLSLRHFVLLTIPIFATCANPSKAANVKTIRLFGCGESEARPRRKDSHEKHKEARKVSALRFLCLFVVFVAI